MEIPPGSGRISTLGRISTRGKELEVTPAGFPTAWLDFLPDTLVGPDVAVERHSTGGGDRLLVLHKHSKDPKSSSPNTPPLRLLPLPLPLPHWMIASLTQGREDKAEVCRCPKSQERIQNQALCRVAQWWLQVLMLRGKKKKCPTPQH